MMPISPQGFQTQTSYMAENYIITINITTFEGLPEIFTDHSRASTLSMVKVNTGNSPDYSKPTSHLRESLHIRYLHRWSILSPKSLDPPDRLRAEILLNRGVITNDDRYESNQTVGADEVLVWSVLAHLAMVLSFPQHANKGSFPTPLLPLKSKCHIVEIPSNS
jgi:hypothetical protein